MSSNGQFVNPVGVNSTFQDRTRTVLTNALAALVYRTVERAFRNHHKRTLKACREDKTTRNERVKHETYTEREHVLYMRLIRCICPFQPTHLLHAATDPAVRLAAGNVWKTNKHSTHTGQNAQPTNKGRLPLSVSGEKSLVHVQSFLTALTDIT